MAYDPLAPTQNVFDTSAGAYKQGVNILDMAANPYAVNMTMNQFLNPYRDMVINDSVSRLRDRRSMDLNMVKSQAAMQGAYGGARQGLVESDLIDRYGRDEDELVSRLLQQGYDTSSNLALQRIGQQAGIGGSMIGAGPVGFQLGQGALGMQSAAGLQQQQLMQDILSQAGMQTENYINYPQQSLNTAMSGIMGNPLAAQQTTKQRYNPGLFDYMSMGAGMLGGGK